jgi:hypothetical protein
MHGAHEVRGSAAVAATDLEYPFAGEVRLGRRAVVELDAEPVGLVGRRQWQCHRRILFVAVAEEQHFIGAQQAGR